MASARLVLVACISLAASAHLASAQPWSPRDYPNPNSSPASCGRVKSAPSSICDPDGVIPVAAADRVDGIVDEIISAREPYGSSGCSEQPGYQVKRCPQACALYSFLLNNRLLRQDTGSIHNGVSVSQVAVALVKRMLLPPGMTAAAAAAAFANDLFKTWGVGEAQCENGVLLFLAVADRQVSSARRLLIDEQVLHQFCSL